MADPSNVLAIDDIGLMTGYEVRPVVASRDDILALVQRSSRLDQVVTTADEGPEEQAEVVDLRETADDAPVIKLVNQIIAQAIELGASDIHFEPGDGSMRVRFRVDGVLSEAASVPRRMVAGVVSRVKIMGDLDIAERRLPQDGRISLTIDGHAVDLRVVTLPSVHGEGVVMRILDKSNVVLELDKLGMADPERLRFERAIRQTLRRRPRHRPDGLRQDDDALRGPRAASTRPRRTSSRSRTRSSTSSRASRRSRSTRRPA